MNPYTTDIPKAIDFFNNIDVKEKLSGINTDKKIIRNKENICRLISFLDLTTLEGNDTFEKVKTLCDTAKNPSNIKGVPSVAAVCVYPRFVNWTSAQLKGTGVKTATVSSYFPSGQVPLELKLAEVQYCIDHDADEIDIVISRGEFLSGNYSFVFDEIFEINKLCKSNSNKKNVHLKVILETGELKTPGNIYAASLLAIEGGADFIKTSTGKISPAATLEASYVMLCAVKEHFGKTGKKIGFKAAGGIRKTDEALEYASLVNAVCGKDWLNPDLFRIGASSLLKDLVSSISN
ncbi:MAG TPA: deoxyribose-phosphate aldolase [Ignavibacteria bacterium]|nr:deoxyribose-phosphate aldolase [Ignavibacteria bacterium]